MKDSLKNAISLDRRVTSIRTSAWKENNKKNKEDGFLQQKWTPSNCINGFQKKYEWKNIVSTNKKIRCQWL